VHNFFKSESLIRELNEEDFKKALNRVKAATNEEVIKKYEKWDEQFGAF